MCVRENLPCSCGLRASVHSIILQQSGLVLSGPLDLLMTRNQEDESTENTIFEYLGLRIV